ncbi:MAG: class I SAM-dependent methyltransferase [Candidatus Omnitrophota bacterium]
MAKNSGVANRFDDEDIGLHWSVDESEESFRRLLHHIEVKSNFKPYFEEALKHLDLDSSSFPGDMVICDIGAGVGWSSALSALHPKVKTVYIVDPSENRLARAGFVAKHFGVGGKVIIRKGTFADPGISEKVDIVLMCASLHHCRDDQIPGLFSNIKMLLKPAGKVLIANEHYVDPLWTLKRAVSCLAHYRDRSRFYKFADLRASDPYGGEHWRTKREIEEMMRQNGFDAAFYLHKGDLCKDKASLYHKLGWHYYHAIASPNKRQE